MNDMEWMLEKRKALVESMVPITLQWEMRWNEERQLNCGVVTVMARGMRNREALKEHFADFWKPTADEMVIWDMEFGVDISRLWTCLRKESFNPDTRMHNDYREKMYCAGLNFTLPMGFGRN